MINNISQETIHDLIKKDITILYKNGPIDTQIMEEIAYCKLYFPEVFSIYEQEILFAMGLFYKTGEPQTLLEKSLNIFKEEIKATYGNYYTPDQSLMRKNISESLYYSFSAPTSSGKSYIFRDLIYEAEKDIVVIVPSRALISEYYLTVIELVPKDVLVMTFVDNINKSKTNRRIFILTPERATEIFKFKNEFNIELFLFDEAQLTEEKIRGLKFDALVRRIIKEFPNAKKVFAHPFIENPEIHFIKHSIDSDKKVNNFRERTVGQLFYFEDNKHFYLYSPYEKVSKPAPVLQDDNIITRTLSNDGTILIYISKTKIYDLRFLKEFSELIKSLPDITDPNALELIEKLRIYLGASKTKRGKQSLLINLMKKGIVLHHGSIPLKGRIIIEEFIKNEYARICFATSTLLRGINMPFDIVIIDNFLNLTTLDFKNLIGRAGRTNRTNLLNIGFVICDKKHINKIIDKMGELCEISYENDLDAPMESFGEDEKDIVDAIKNNEFVDSLNIPTVQFERLKNDINLIPLVEDLINLLIPNGYPITGEDYVSLSKKERDKIKNSLKKLYLSSLRNPNLTKAEASVVSTSLPILLWKIQGKSFKETVQLRYNYITNKKEQLVLKKKLKEQEITEEEFTEQIEKMTIKYSQGAFTIPNKHKGAFTLFDNNTPINKCDYDRLIYDTYDYLDKVISLSLVDPINAALEIYYQEKKDLRARALQNYIKYSTNSQFDILLLRYGFDFEDHDWIKPCISSISEDGIIFNENIHKLKKELYKQVERYF